MTRTKRKPHRAGVLAAALLLGMAHAGAAPAAAMQILDAADHAELSAPVSATGVIRVALLGDRIARVIRAPGGFRVEHDPGAGDLYLRPLLPGPGGAAPADPVALFVGTERGFTYRLTLTPTARGSAQILIRNPNLTAASKGDATADASDARIAAIAGLIRAVATREPLAGYAIETGPEGDDPAITVVEVWRGPRFSAWVMELGADAPADAPALADLAAARLGPRSQSGAGPDIAAVWLAEPGPAGGRLAVAVFEGDPR